MATRSLWLQCASRPNWLWIYVVGDLTLLKIYPYGGKNPDEVNSEEHTRENANKWKSTPMQLFFILFRNFVPQVMNNFD